MPAANRAFDRLAFELGLAKAGTPYRTVDVPTFGPVGYYELARPGPRLSYVGRQVRGERSFFVWPYEAAWGFCSYQLGYSYLSDAGKGGSPLRHGVFRKLPQPFPLSNFRTGRPLAYATDIESVEGVGPDGVLTPAEGGGPVNSVAGNFQIARVKLVYGSLPYPMRPDADMPQEAYSNEPDEGRLYRYVMRTFAPSAKHVQYPSGSMSWQSDAQVTTQTVGKILPFVDVNYTWFAVPAVPECVYKAIGRVNKLPFDGSAAGRLLITGIDLTPLRQVTTERAFDVVYRMRYFDGGADNYLVAPGLVGPDAVVGHNHFVRFLKATSGPGAGVQSVFKYDRPYALDPDNVTKRYVFEAFEFGDLFRGPFLTATSDIGTY